MHSGTQPGNRCRCCGRSQPQPRQELRPPRRLLGEQFVANAQTEAPNMRVALGCADGCTQELCQQHGDWMKGMKAKDGGDEGRKRQADDGRRRHEHVLLLRQWLGVRCPTGAALARSGPDL